MKERREAFEIILRAGLYSMTVSLFLALILGVIFLYIPMTRNLEQTYLITLRVDAVLLGFGGALFAFLIRQEVKRRRFIYFAAFAAFLSFAASIMTAFVGLLSEELHPILANPIIPISFTLCGTFTSITLLVIIGFATEEKKEYDEKKKDVEM